MSIFADLSTCLNRIAQITGAPAAPAPPSGAAPSEGAGSFADVLRRELEAGPGGAPEFGGRAVEAFYPTSSTAYGGLVQASAERWNVDPALVNAVIANESGFDPRATSKVGAMGLMQLMPSTAAGLGVTDAYDPAQNIAGGVRYLRGLLDRFNGNLPLAIAAYNAGPGAVEKYGGIPPYGETQRYVAAVLDSYRRYRGAT
ncbi:MAG TPA: lytic transglycosylase domain-containing protein [Candidatus Dormibacteraeota bacterium]|nr:lytic transglycosylase domain-containing protein [Candidatus Dormibacteraeota bacterium]